MILKYISKNYFKKNVSLKEKNKKSRYQVYIIIECKLLQYLCMLNLNKNN